MVVTSVPRPQHTAHCTLLSKSSPRNHSATLLASRCSGLPQLLAPFVLLLLSLQCSLSALLKEISLSPKSSQRVQGGFQGLEILAGTPR